MGTGKGYFGEPTETSSLPAQVKTVRVLLYIAAGFTVLLIIGSLVGFGVTAELVGALVWNSWPGVVGFVVALKIRNPSRLKFWLIIVVAVMYVINSLGQLGTGDARGITTLILPVLILAFVLQRASRKYFFQRPAED